MAGESSSGAAAGGMGVSFEEHAGDNSMFAVSTTTVEFLNHIENTMCSFLPDHSLHSSGRETIDKGAVFARAMCAQGFEALEKDAHARDLPEQYPQYSGYRCQDCVERRNLAVGLPFESFSILQHTRASTPVLDSAKDGHVHVVFQNKGLVERILRSHSSPLLYQELVSTHLRCPLNCLHSLMYIRI